MLDPAAMLAQFDGGLDWPDIYGVFEHVPKNQIRNFVGEAEDHGLLVWRRAGKARGQPRAPGRWLLTDLGRAFVRDGAKGSA
jgi:hypothetical protein